ncbi:MAG: fused MFS/spermidine synthase, partial [Firmicutes bacterium]|nr:fused MFS/spermidine synthase [Bacillota bacterium]
MNDILKSKAYLYMTEFFSGMSVMAVELAASRLMAPYFSSSQIVYTIIIGTVMIAMALGNVYGGRTADKDPDPAVLYRRMLIAGAWIAAIPLVGRYLILGISALLIFTVDQNFLIIAAFVSCMLIFVFPLFLLGTVTPSLVRYIMENADHSGEIVGRLGAYNTIGSIIGTFLPTFVTIPAVGTAATFVIFSGILILIAAAYFFSAKKVSRTLIVSVIVFLLCAVLGTGASFAFWEDDLAYEGESVYNYLQVSETGDRV